MLICLPVSFRSWDYEVINPSEIEGTPAGATELSFREQGQRGHLRMEDVQYAVRKLAGEARWIVEDRSRVWMEAVMPDPESRTFVISGMGHEIRVSPRPGSARSWLIHSDGQLAGGMRRANFFSRKAYIECRPEVPEMARLFAFWLMAVYWRKGAAMGQS